MSHIGPPRITYAALQFHIGAFIAFLLGTTLPPLAVRFRHTDVRGTKAQPEEGGRGER